MLFQLHVFWYYLIISESVKYIALLHVIVTFIEENITLIVQPSRNLRASNHLCYFWKNHFAWAIYCPRAKYSFLQQCNNLLLIFATYASDKWKPSGNYGFHKYKEFVRYILSNSLFHWQLKQSVSIWNKQVMIFWLNTIDRSTPCWGK